MWLQLAWNSFCKTQAFPGKSPENSCFPQTPNKHWTHLLECILSSCFPIQIQAVSCTLPPSSKGMAKDIEMAWVTFNSEF